MSEWFVTLLQNFNYFNQNSLDNLIHVMFNPYLYDWRWKIYRVWKKIEIKAEQSGAVRMCDTFS